MNIKSGSVISPTLAAQIQAAGERVVVVLIGSTSSQIEINNSIKTLMSFDSIAAREKSPIVVHYLENSEEHSRAAIDDAAVAAVKALLVLFSGQNDELDTADLRHWLAHKDLNNELVSLHFCSSQEGYMESGAVVSVATLARAHHNTTLKPLPAYQAVGYLTTPEELSFIGDTPLHYAISADLITSTHKRLTAKLKEVTDQLNSVVGRERLYDKNANVTDNGLIL